MVTKRAEAIAVLGLYLQAQRMWLVGYVLYREIVKIIGLIPQIIHWSYEQVTL